MIKKQIFKMGIMLTLVSPVLFSLTACGIGTAENQQELVKVTRGKIVLSVTGEGVLTLPQHRKLTFGTTGEILAVNVEEGDRVTKGQVLAKLDATTLQRMVKNAELAVTTAELAVTAAELAVNTAEINIRVAENGIKAAEIELEQATDSYRKITYPYTYATFLYDVPEARAKIRDARRQVDDARELLELSLTSSVLSELRSQLKQAQDNLVKAEQTLARGTGQDVFGDEFLPVKDFWTLRAAQLEKEKAESALTQAKDNRDKAMLALEKARNDHDKAKLTLDMARSDLDNTRDELKKAIIHAPFNGIIAKADAKPGEALSSQNYATRTIIEITDPRRMEFEAEIDEVDIPEVKRGQRVLISVDALPDLALEGEVTFIPPLSREEPGLVLYDVKIAFDAPQDFALRGGMRATADIVINERSGVLLVPNEAITLDSQGKPVVTVMVNEQGQERAVVTGISNGSKTEVLKGLNEGDMVAIERLD